jgi:serine protease Do
VPPHRIVRGYVGIYMGNLELGDSERLDIKGGTVVVSVQPDFPAAEAGIKKGDVIIRYNGANIRDMAQLRKLVQQSPPGSKAKVENLRLEGSRVVEKKFDLVIRERPPLDQQAWRP